MVPQLLRFSSFLVQFDVFLINGLELLWPWFLPWWMTAIRQPCTAYSRFRHANCLPIRGVALGGGRWQAEILGIIRTTEKRPKTPTRKSDLAPDFRRFFSHFDDIFIKSACQISAPTGTDGRRSQAYFLDRTGRFSNPSFRHKPRVSRDRIVSKGGCRDRKSFEIRLILDMLTEFCF